MSFSVQEYEGRACRVHKSGPRDHRFPPNKPFFLLVVILNPDTGYSQKQNTNSSICPQTYIKIKSIVLSLHFHTMICPSQEQKTDFVMVVSKPLDEEEFIREPSSHLSICNHEASVSVHPFAGSLKANGTTMRKKWMDFLIYFCVHREGGERER